jgi:hypothetical protein
MQNRNFNIIINACRGVHNYVNDLSVTTEYSHDPNPPCFFLFFLLSSPLYIRNFVYSSFLHWLSPVTLCILSRVRLAIMRSLASGAEATVSQEHACAIWAGIEYYCRALWAMAEVGASCISASSSLNWERYGGIICVLPVGYETSIASRCLSMLPWPRSQTMSYLIGYLSRYHIIVACALLDDTEAIPKGEGLERLQQNFECLCSCWSTAISLNTQALAPGIGYWHFWVFYCLCSI